MSLLSVGLDDLRLLHCELHLVSDKWFSLGVQLQVSIETLKSIQSNNCTAEECLLEMLTVWLKQINPPCTWDVLIEALDSPPVGERLLAQQLRDKYCPRTERANQTYLAPPDDSFLSHISQGVYAIASLKPRPSVPDFVSQLWRKVWNIKLIFLQSCKTKSGMEGLGLRL